MAAITASLERSLQSLSLNHRSTTTSSTAGGGEESTDTHCHRSATSNSDATLELNSNITLPYHWEQSLDLKTGQMYYINWRTGMKSKDDPRTVDDDFNAYFYMDDGEEEDDDDEESFYADSESSSEESSPAALPPEKQKGNNEEGEGENRVGGHVLVVAGCKGCFMYFMVPKKVQDCPKCCGQLLHFDRSDDN
ncbi:hypothetical protein R6Q57_019975 [Mikania cordata]